MKKLIAINLVLLAGFMLLPNIHIEEAVEVADEITQEEVVEESSVKSKEEVVEESSVKSKEVTSRGGFNDRIERNLKISYDMDLRTKSNLTESDLEEAFKNTGMADLGKYFVQAEKEYGVNALYLAALGAHESAWGTSDFAKERNNLFGWQSYDSNLNATKYFETKGDGVLVVANSLSKNYLTEGGCYFNGYTMKDVSKKYASDKEHSTKIYGVMKTIVSRIEK